mgnify:CR=1 FL=1
MLLSESKEFIFFHLYKTAGTSLRHVLNEDCKPQYIFFSENSDESSPITLDFMGRFESLHKDVDFLKSKLGLDGELPHYVKSNHAPYKEYYNETTQKMIADAYHKDVSYFNYTF